MLVDLFSKLRRVFQRLVRTLFGTLLAFQISTLKQIQHVITTEGDAIVSMGSSTNQVCVVSVFTCFIKLKVSSGYDDAVSYSDEV